VCFETGNWCDESILEGATKRRWWSPGYVTRKVGTVGGKDYAILKAYNLKSEGFIGFKP